MLLAGRFRIHHTGVHAQINRVLCVDAVLLRVKPGPPFPALSGYAVRPACMPLRGPLPTHARSLLRAACIPAIAVSRLETGVGNMGAVEYALAFSRFAGRHMGRNSGSEGGHGSPEITHASSPRRISSEPNVVSAVAHNSSGDEPYWLAHLWPYRLAILDQNTVARSLSEPFRAVASGLLDD